MNRLDSASIILALSEQLSANGSWSGETHMQKAAYLLTRVLEVPLGFDFILYKHGPFSFELRDELSALRGEGFLAWEVRAAGYGPSLKSGSLGDALKKQFPEYPNKYKDQIRFVAERLGAKNVNDLERFATAVFVTYEDRTKTNERAIRINNIKPHITIPEAEAAIVEADSFLKDAEEIGARCTTA